ncbi:MAG: hypothetical protein WCP92_05255 [bacterium]
MPLSSLGKVKFIFGCNVGTLFGSIFTIPLTTLIILVFVPVATVFTHIFGAKFGAIVTVISLLSVLFFVPVLMIGA